MSGLCMYRYNLVGGHWSMDDGLFECLFERGLGMLWYPA